jgi:hypothetical protein
MEAGSRGGAAEDPRQMALTAKRRALIQLHEQDTIGDYVYQRLLDEVDVIAEAVDAEGTDGRVSKRTIT